MIHPEKILFLILILIATVLLLVMHYSPPVDAPETFAVNVVDEIRENNLDAVAGPIGPPGPQGPVGPLYGPFFDKPLIAKEGITIEGGTKFTSGNGDNYIKGATEVTGDVKSAGDMLVGGAMKGKEAEFTKTTVNKLCIGEICLTESDLKRMNSRESDGIYDFVSHKFTNCGASGPYGPTLDMCRRSYSSSIWANNRNFFRVNNRGIQEWVVPRTGNYRFVIRGARGGGNSNNRSGGGRGAQYTGERRLNKNDVIYILVGQKGGDYNWSQLGGGGGGTFITLNQWNVNNLIAAAGGGGGGGGGGYVFNNHYRSHASSSTSGNTNAYGNVSGGSNGRGGNYRSYYSGAYGSGGAGWNGNGNGYRGRFTPSSVVSARGVGAISVYGASSNSGGFGGGGSGWGGGGGGGGYSGGGGGNWSTYSNGGGGGSYITGFNSSSWTTHNDDHGSVTITYISP